MQQGKTSAATPADTSHQKILTGKWIHHFPKKDVIIEIKDTSHVFVYGLFDKNKSTDTLFSTMGSFSDTTIWIKIPTARFDYKVRGDSLIEFDKMGEQAVYIKVKPPEE